MTGHQTTTHVDSLDGRQKKALHAALLSAFPRQPALERLVEFQLDTRLSVVAGDGPLADVVHRLIEWAEAHGRIDALVEGAREVNPGNPHLAELERLLREPSPPQPSSFPRPLTQVIAGGRPGCAIAITIAVVAAFAIPIAWMARDGHGTRPPAVSTVEPRATEAPAGRPRRRVEVEIPFHWEPRPQAGGCRTDAEWQRLLLAGTSTGDWPADPEARELQLVSLAEDVAVEHAEVFMRGGQVAEAVATGQPRGIVRKWRFPVAVTTPVRIAVCLQARGKPPSPALRVTTWTRGDREGPSGG